MNDLYFYSIGFDHFESSSDITLSSVKLYSEEEFKDLCATITADLYTRRRELFADRYVTIDKWNQKMKEQYKSEPEEVIGELLQDPFCKFEDLYDRLISELTERHGFELLPITAEFNPFGCAKIIPKTDLNGDYVGEQDDIHLIRNKIKD